MTLKLHRRGACLLLSLASLNCGIATTTHAQGADVVMEEIVVTARKRGTESIQDIGGSIQVLDGDALAETVSIGFADYMREVPGLSANSSGTGQAQLSMRGISAARLNHANPNIPSTVSLYFDETPISTSGFNPDSALFDLNRVEVLRGPQGTLFGASSMSGAIRLIPNDPVMDELRATASVTGFGTEDGSGSYSGHGILNLPVNDRFALRGVAYNVSNGGYIDNIYTGEEDYNDENILGGRLTGLWDVTNSLSAKAMVMYQNLDADGRPQEQRRNDPAETTTGFGYDLALPGESLDQLIITDERQNVKFVDNEFEDEFVLASLQLDLEVDRYSFTSITSYFDREMDNTLDDTRRTRNLLGLANALGAAGQPVFALGDYDPVTLDGAIFLEQVDLENKTRNEKFTQELRVNSRFSGPFNFVAGLYFEDDSRQLDQVNDLDGLDAWIASPAGLDGFALGSTFGSPLENAYFDGTFDVDTTQFAAFAEASYEFGDYELTAGGRFFDYEQEAFIRWQGWVEFSNDRLDEKTSESGFNPMVELAYRPSDDMTLYAKAAKGFRVGSVQQFINPVFCADELADLGFDGVPTTIDGDSLWNYEAGAKTTLFGGTTTANISVYQMDWEDARTQTFLACGWIVEFSIVDIVSRGVELEIVSQPTDRLGLSFAAAYNQSEVDGDLDPSAPPIASDGDEAPFAPEWAVNAGFRYEIANALRGLDWYLRGDVSYVSSQFNELGTEQLERIELPSSTVLNLYTGMMRDNWEFGVFVRNLTDERIVMGADTDRQRPAQLTVGRPRNAGVQFTYNFAGD
ncbi:TonB-dependent receptor [Lentisalinibacter sediminis]|uniref:TonB-dependent receptor n=1 Tax=Lentisalinibacter sediminis TaxID=2992237 RepID=UPI00386DB0B5